MSASCVNCSSRQHMTSELRVKVVTSEFRKEGAIKFA